MRDAPKGMMRPYAAEKVPRGAPPVSMGEFTRSVPDRDHRPGILTEIIIGGRAMEIESFTELLAILREYWDSQYAPHLLPSCEKKRSE